MRIQVLVSAATLLLVAAGAGTASDGMKITPGSWEFVHRTAGMMGAPPTTRTTTECVREDSVSPDRFLSDMQTDCTVHDVAVTDTSMKWTLRCATPGGQMTGVGSFRSAGTTATGTMTVTMAMGGQSFEMESSWKGRRVGDCP